MMNESTKTPSCERGNDLVSFLYGEVNDIEAREFEQHLQQCDSCRSEAASFEQVRDSIGVWKEEALSVFVPPQTFAPVRTKSALAALHEFFDLSPLWLKGAFAFATLLFCAMLVLTLSRSSATKSPNPLVSNGKYTDDQVKQIVKQAIDEQTAAQVASSNTKSDEQQVVDPMVPEKKKTYTGNNRASQLARRRSLSKSEREQLAADLRLFSTRDDESLNLLGDKINQEF